MSSGTLLVNSILAEALKRDIKFSEDLKPLLNPTKVITNLFTLDMDQEAFEKQLDDLEEASRCLVPSRSSWNQIVNRDKPQIEKAVCFLFMEKKMMGMNSESLSKLLQKAIEVEGDVRILWFGVPKPRKGSQGWMSVDLAYLQILSNKEQIVYRFTTLPGFALKNEYINKD